MQLRSVACLAALTLLFAQPARTQQTVQSAEPATTTSAAPPVVRKAAVEANEASEPDESGDGSIKIHGHWVLTVKNADGSVADSRDFENSLVTQGSRTTGSQVLVALLSGNAVTAPPALALLQQYYSGAGDDDTTQCANHVTNCTFFATANSPLGSTAGAGAAPIISGLSASVNFVSPVSVILSGNLQNTGTSPLYFFYVQSFFPICVPNSFPFTNSGQLTSSAGEGDENAAPSSCSSVGAVGAGDSLLFPPLTSTVVTQGGIPLAETVAPGQSLTIVFTLTFS